MYNYYFKFLINENMSRIATTRPMFNNYFKIYINDNMVRVL
jgi:hypothetical protein